MRQFALRSMNIFALRWLRGWGYRGQRPGLFYGLALALLVGASIGAGIWTHSQFRGFDQLPAQFRPPVLGVLVVFLFISGGLMLLLTESIRLSGSRLGAVLGTLPLTAREIRILLWLPVFAASLAMQLLFFVPAVAAFSALRFPPDQAVLVSLAALLSGYGMAAVVVAFVRRALGGSRWAAVQYPVMLMGWMALCGVAIWQTVADASKPQAWRAVLLAPWVAREAGQGQVSSWQFGAVILGIVATVALLLWSGGRPSEVNYPRVAWLWSSRWKPPLMTLELTRMLRSTYLVANLIGGEVVSLGLAFALWKLPSGLRTYLFVAILSTMMLFCTLPLLLIRGLTRARWPPALLVGYRPTEWTLAQIGVGLILAVTLAVPPLALSVWLIGSAGTVLGLGLPLLALSCGLTIYVGWLTPLSPDDPLGQAVSTFSLFVSIQLLELGLDHAFHARSAAWTTSVVVIGSLGIAAAAFLERRRWSQTVGSVSYA